MINRFKTTAALILALIIAVSLSACGNKTQEFETGGESSGGLWSAITSGAEASPAIKQITFAAGTIPADAENIELVLKAEEIEKLDEFASLKSVNFLDSSCYVEIAEWAGNHPEVKVQYLVSFPNGVSVPYDTAELDLSGLTTDSAQEAAKAIKYLPQLEQITLGEQPKENGLGAQAIGMLKAAAGDAVFDISAYGINVGNHKIGFSDETLDLIGVSDEELEEILPLFEYMQALTDIELGNSDTSPDLSWDSIAKVLDAASDTMVHYTFTVYGKEFSVSDATIDLNHMTLGDNGAEIRALLPYLHRCTYLDMDTCGISNEVMAQLRDDFPAVKVVWRINWANYSVRTDVEKILASKPSEGGHVTSADLDVLKYCTDVKYLDIGHNESIDDVSFIQYMTKLEVAIIGMNEVSDISCLANCPELEYLEIGTSNVSDLTPLQQSYKLRHLNIVKAKVSDITPVMDLELYRFFIGGNSAVPASQIEEYMEKHPDAIVNAEVLEGSDANWRYLGGTWPLSLYPRYSLLCEQMGYVAGGESDYCFYWRDPRY